MHVYGACEHKCVVAPYALEYFLAREHAPGLAHQQFEYAELLGCEHYFAAARSYGLGGSVDFYSSERHYLVFVGFGVFCRRLAAAQHCCHAGQNLVYGERFGDVVVASGREACEQVVFRVLGCEEYHGYVVFQFGAQFFCHGKARHPAHHDIEEYQVVLRAEHVEGFFGRRSGVYFISCALEVDLEDFAQIRFVVYY